MPGRGDPPFLLKTGDNPEGVDGQVFESIKAATVMDRYACFVDFLDNFYNADTFCWSDQRPGLVRLVRGRLRHLAGRHYACADTWLTDLRDDLPKIDVPVRRSNGTAECILPYETFEAAARVVEDLRLVTVDGGPHNVGWTHPEKVNEVLLEFLAAQCGARHRRAGSREAPG